MPNAVKQLLMRPELLQLGDVTFDKQFEPEGESKRWDEMWNEIWESNQRTCCYGEYSIMQNTTIILEIMYKL